LFGPSPIPGKVGIDPAAAAAADSIVLVRKVALGVIGGEQYVDALVDTGSTYCIVPRRMATLLGFNKGNRLGTKQVSVVGGWRRMDRHRLERIRVGTARVHGVPILVDQMGAGFSPFMLLGLAFLQKFNVTIDFDRDEILFLTRKS
jgi:clan AA aspartic protease (TIGR02281 family)